MKKSILVRVVMTMVLWMATMTADAANVQYLTIVVNGKAVSFSLAEHPVITYANNTLVVKTATEEVEIPVASISGYEFEEEPSAVRDLQLGKPSIGGGRVVFTQLQPGASVQVFTTDGRKVASATAGSNGTAMLDLSTQPKATYVVKSPESSFKVINK